MLCVEMCQLSGIAVAGLNVSCFGQEYPSVVFFLKIAAGHFLGLRRSARFCDQNSFCCASAVVAPLGIMGSHCRLPETSKLSSNIVPRSLRGVLN